MTKPPSNIDPEKFIIGRGVYSNQRTAITYCDEHEFRIDPAPLPIVMIVSINLFLALGIVGMCWGVTLGRGGSLLLR